MNKIFEQRNVRFCHIAFLMSFMAFGCAPEKLKTTGEIFFKKHEPLEIRTNITVRKHYVGKHFMTFPVNTKIIDDEDFIVYIKKVSSQTGEDIETKIYVTRKIYESVKLGDSFIMDTNNCVLSDEEELIYLE